jgi:hypothetical protein
MGGGCVPFFSNHRQPAPATEGKKNIVMWGEELAVWDRDVWERGGRRAGMPSAPDHQPNIAGGCDIGTAARGSGVRRGLRRRMGCLGAGKTKARGRGPRGATARARGTRAGGWDRIPRCGRRTPARWGRGGVPSR